jgi:hypothetical protein
MFTDEISRLRFTHGFSYDLNNLRLDFVTIRTFNLLVAIWLHILCTYLIQQQEGVCVPCNN